MVGYLNFLSFPFILFATKIHMILLLVFQMLRIHDTYHDGYLLSFWPSIFLMKKLVFFPNIYNKKEGSRINIEKEGSRYFIRVIFIK